MVVFDLTDRESFINVDGWLNEIQKHCGTDVNILVLANKVDIAQKQANRDQNNEYNEEDDQEREIEVTDEDIATFEKTHNLKVLKTSAKSGQGVDEAFLEMTKALIKKNNSLSPEEKQKQLQSGKLGGGGHKGLNGLQKTNTQGGGSCC